MKAEYIDHMGTDLSVVNAARVSFDKVSELERFMVEEDDGLWYEDERLHDDDAKLIKFLAKHDHWTPFAHTSVSLRMKAPVPIRTQCFKHKAGLVENEESRRYIKSTPEVYYPKEWRKAAANVKQGSSDEQVLALLADKWGYTCAPHVAYRDAAEHCVGIYEWMINSGVCPEQARFVLPQGCYVNWVWTGNLYSFSNFYNKRTHPTAQREVREVAEAVAAIIEPLFPVSWKALTQEA